MVCKLCNSKMILVDLQADSIDYTEVYICPNKSCLSDAVLHSNSSVCASWDRDDIVKLYKEILGGEIDVLKKMS